MRICLIIPMKDPGEAKSRLGDTLPGKARAALARTLFRQTLRMITSLNEPPHVLVVTSSDEIIDICAPFALHVLADSGQGLNAAISAGARWASLRGYDAVCVLPGDLADPQADDLARVLATASTSGGVTIAPAHDGGTNALLVCPPDAIDFAYGANSSAAHQRAAEQAGLPCLLMPLPSLLYDVDRSSDLSARLVRGLDRSLGMFGT